LFLGFFVLEEKTMVGKVKGSILAAAVLSAAAASQAQASFTYDLRFADGSHSKTVTSADAGTTVTVQLWAQITGDSTLTNDGFQVGYINLQSSLTGGGAFTGGGLLSGTTLGSHVGASGSNLGTAAANISLDGVADWGSSATSTNAGWMVWRGGNAPGFVDGVTDTESHSVNANTWEVLLGTFTVTINNVNPIADQNSITHFQANFAPLVKIGSPNTTSKGVLYYQDQLTTPNADTTQVSTVGLDFFGPVNVPEPASLGVLALGGLGLLARRRRA